MEAEQGCTTPKNQLPAAQVCPPPPRKKVTRQAKAAPPKNGYFQSPELEMFFTNGAKGRQAWAQF
ncbi:hypothetical protein ACS0TY_015707 [Phlomoides rotata]